MNNENENCEIFDEGEAITLYDDKGNPLNFYEEACVELDGKFYVLLSPAEEIEGIAEDEVVICSLEMQDDDTQLIVPVEDEELMQGYLMSILTPPTNAIAVAATEIAIVTTNANTATAVVATIAIADIKN